MRSILSDVLAILSKGYSTWILWNLFLAFIPLLFSFWLFRRKTKVRSPLWWTGLILFIAFLPNAPYMLTDIIHLIQATRHGHSAWVITLIFIPVHAFAILSGFEAYVLSLLNQGHYLKQQGASPYVIWAELMVHALCAIGVFLGRFRRFNSWDIVTDPGDILLSTIDDLTTKRPLLVIAITFVIITGLYWLLKQVTLGLVLRIRSAHRGVDPLDADDGFVK